jgi:threonine dehydratase
MQGATIVHPYNDELVIAGQATLGMEILEQVPDCETILVPTSGGGMLAGIALAVEHFHAGPRPRVHAVEPKGKRLGDAFAAGTRIIDSTTSNLALDTLADAMPTQALGTLPWNILHEEASAVSGRVLTVDDAQIRAAMHFAFERLKVVVEPAAATGLAVLLNGQGVGAALAPNGGTIVVVLCGDNVNLSDLPSLLGSED